MVQGVYLLLCVLGTVLPYASFIPWLAVNGLALPLMWQQIMASPLSVFAWSDVLVSALALLVFMRVESRRLGMARAWLPLVGLFSVGVSLALPWFLWMRARHLAAQKA